MKAAIRITEVGGTVKTWDLVIGEADSGAGRDPGNGKREKCSKRGSRVRPHALFVLIADVGGHAFTDLLVNSHP